MKVGRTIGSCRLPLVGRAINPSFPISVFRTNRGLGNLARSRWGDIGGLMGIRRNEANLWAGGFRGIGGPDQGARRRRGRLPHWRNVGGASAVTFERVHVRIDATSRLNVHMDTDEANASGLHLTKDIELIK